MADDGFNGTTFQFGTTPVETGLLSCSYEEAGAEVKVSGSDAVRQLFTVGIPKETISLTVAGVSAIAVGDAGAITIAWFDGSTSSVTGAKCASTAVSGGEDEQITTALTFVRDTAQAA